MRALLDALRIAAPVVLAALAIVCVLGAACGDAIARIRESASAAPRCALRSGARFLWLFVAGATDEMLLEAAVELGICSVREIGGRRVIVGPRLDDVSAEDAARLRLAVYERLGIDDPDAFESGTYVGATHQDRVAKLSHIVRQFGQHHPRGGAVRQRPLHRTRAALAPRERTAR